MKFFRKFYIRLIAFLYQHVLKPLLFLIEPDIIHVQMVKIGELLGRHNTITTVTSSLFAYTNPILEQNIEGISFKNPIGLAAGFDYEARLTQILPAIGFGFQSIGTITNFPYKGNPHPMLGRLPKSKSLMVNKGYKNLGVKKTIKHLEDLSFNIPVGVSVGRTNTKELMTQSQSVEDIIQTFTHFEQAKIPFSYYELNISCPNLYGNISFYPSKNLQELLKEVDGLHLSRPVFVKMPIEKNDKETIEMLEIISKHTPKGIIIGNLQKDRKNVHLDIMEVAKYSVGYFSGKPTFERSNELIRVSYRHFKNRFTIIGCGGVFNPEDAYEKILSGASLVQLITGMIYMGPQLICDINMQLVDLLARDGFTHISQAIGSKYK